MKIFRISTLLALAAAAASGALLFWTSQSVQQEQTRLRSLERARNNEEQALRVLRAEWAYLNRPDRLEALARGHLNMVPPDRKYLMSPPTGLPIPAPQENPPLEMKMRPAALEKASAPADATQRAIPVPLVKPALKSLAKTGRDFQKIIDELRGSGEGKP